MRSRVFFFPLLSDGWVSWPCLADLMYALEVCGGHNEAGVVGEVFFAADVKCGVAIINASRALHPSEGR